MNNELYHHGILGMKWGVRRYQNYDGTLKNPKRTTRYGSYIPRPNGPPKNAKVDGYDPELHDRSRYDMHGKLIKRMKKQNAENTNLLKNKIKSSIKQKSSMVLDMDTKQKRKIANGASWITGIGSYFLAREGGYNFLTSATGATVVRIGTEYLVGKGLGVSNKKY